MLEHIHLYFNQRHHTYHIQTCDLKHHTKAHQDTNLRTDVCITWVGRTHVGGIPRVFHAGCDSHLVAPPRAKAGVAHFLEIPPDVPNQETPPWGTPHTRTLPSSRLFLHLTCFWIFDAWMHVHARGRKHCIISPKPGKARARPVTCPSRSTHFLFAGASRATCVESWSASHVRVSWHRARIMLLGSNHSREQHLRGKWLFESNQK